MYKIRCAEQAQSVWDALPDDAREELSLALFDVGEDPYSATAPHPEDDDVKRLLVLEHTLVALLVFKEPVKRVRILEITYLA